MALIVSKRPGASLCPLRLDEDVFGVCVCVFAIRKIENGSSALYLRALDQKTKCSLKVPKTYKNGKSH